MKCITRRPLAVAGGLLMIVGLVYAPPIFAEDDFECLLSQSIKGNDGLALEFLRAIPPHDGAGCTPGGP